MSFSMAVSRTMPDLPLELVYAIVDAVPALADVLSLRAVSRALHAYLTPRAFHCVRVSCEQDLKKRAEGLEKLRVCEGVAQLVREVVLDDEPQDGEEFALKWRQPDDPATLQREPDLAANLTRVFAVLKCFPCVHSVTLNFWPLRRPCPTGPPLCEPSTTFIARQCALVHLILAPTAPWASLTSLTLRNLALLHWQCYAALAGAPSPSWTHLSVRVLSSTEHAAAARLPPGAAGPFVLAPSVLLPLGGGALRELEIGAERGPFGVPDARLRTLEFPHLERLALRNVGVHDMVFMDEQTGKEGFVLRHRASLRMLHLSSVWLLLDPALPALRQSRWADVFDLLADKMDRLVELGFHNVDVQVAEAGKKPAPRLLYVEFDDVEGYVANTSVAEEHREAGCAALERLHEVVETRRLRC